MRRALRRISARAGISLGLVVLIVAIVAVARLTDDPRGPGLFPRFPDATPSVAATEGDDGAVDEAPDTPTDDDHEVLATATGFATAWLERGRPADEWLDGLRPHATEDLLERLTGVDPASVPATAVLGTPAIRYRSAAYAEVVVPIGAGDALVLGLVRPTDGDGRGWVVATLDQEVSLSLGAAPRRDLHRPLVALRLARGSS